MYTYVHTYTHMCVYTYMYAIIQGTYFISLFWAQIMSFAVGKLNVERITIS